MRIRSIPLLLAGTAAALALPDTSPPKSQAEFEELALILEVNVADRDGEVVLHAETGEPIERLALFGPSGQVIHNIDASGGRGLGLSELRLESGEPTPDQVRAAYPAGTYMLRAVTTSGVLFAGTVELTHDTPARWMISTPLADEVVPRGDVTVEWTCDPTAARYTLEIEDQDDEQRLIVSPQPGESQFVVPGALLRPDTEYQLVMVAHSASGNRLVQERYFRTAP